LKPFQQKWIILLSGFDTEIGRRISIVTMADLTKEGTYSASLSNRSISANEIRTAPPGNFRAFRIPLRHHFRMVSALNPSLCPVCS
jgi:hypothetical protein